MSTEIGMLVRARREELGVTQKDLAEQLGVSPTALNRWEKGVRPVPRDRYEKLAELLEIPVEMLEGAQRNARPSEMEAWRDLVFDETTISWHAQLLLLWISRKSRTVEGLAAYIGSPAHAARLVRNLSLKEVEAAWPDVIASPYVRQDPENKNLLFFTFPAAVH